MALVAGLCFGSSATRSESPTIAVLYPDLNEYNAVFESITGGIEKNTTGSVERIPLTEDYSRADLKERLARGSPKGIVALGRRGIEAVRRLSWKGPMVIGAVIRDASLNAQRSPGISLDPDPRKVLGYVKRLAPKIRRVHTIVDPERNAWLVTVSRVAATELGLVLVVKEAVTKRATAIAYRDVLSEIDAEQDALWLPLDPKFDEATLRLVLSEAWERRVVVFSSTPEHAQRGALFSFYPDYPAIGRRLANLLRDQRDTDPLLGSVRPTTDITLAVNLRTARHLRLEFGREIEATFEVVFK